MTTGTRFLKLRPGESETISFKECFFLFAASIEPGPAAFFDSTAILKIHAVQHNDKGFQVLVPLTVCRFRPEETETIRLNLKVGEGQKLTFKVTGTHAVSITGWIQ
ncbi:hypothetical protein C8J55DRAFT_561286 [Lentinula edodes]|uniref:Nucleoplasmin-like domain-containing protein n=1 Tax=Lentinula lateritia TaxID=40482 RepID=A0A9W9ACC6_9AGAR|nr:hypothetical protein C8J55DRAFT_561286 [Lentinula edodes]